MIVQGLPDHSSLDISGTNLAGNGVFDNSGDALEYTVTQSGSEMRERGERLKCDIGGLISRVDNPLNFLGLYKCVYEPNHRTHIPAKQVCCNVELKYKILLPIVCPRYSFPHSYESRCNIFRFQETRTSLSY